MVRRRSSWSMTSGALVGVLALLGVSIAAAVGLASGSDRDGGSAGGEVAVSVGADGTSGPDGDVGGAPAGPGGATRGSGGRRAGAAGATAGSGTSSGGGSTGGSAATEPAGAEPSTAGGTPAPGATGGGAPAGGGGSASASSTASGPSPVPDDEPAEGIVSVSATDANVWFETTRRRAAPAPCADHQLWRAARAHPGAIVAVTAAFDRLVELDPASGAVLGVLATWGATARTATGPGVRSVGAGTAPAVSADGAHLAFGADRDPRADHACAPDVVIRDLVTGAERVLAGDRDAAGDGGTLGVIDRVSGLRWSPDASVLAVTRSYESRWTVLADPTEDGSLDDAPALLSDQAGWTPFDVDWLADGRLVVASSCCEPEWERDGELAVVGADGVPHALDAPEARDRAAGVAIDPTGRHLAYVRQLPAGALELVVRRDLGPVAVVATGYATLAW